jgi:8-oxo-dGTP pyrophosphatase MutT (NUDIX family)
MAIKELIGQAITHYGGRRTQETTTDRPLQTGALPWRIGRKKRFEVLLITGRRSRRWTIPKGWPMAGKTLAEAAAQEAFEEAGVRGTIDPVPVGTFDHTKQNLPSGLLDVRILVHPLNVDRELSKWPEVGQRRRKWFSVEEAAKKVDSEELRALIVISAERALAGGRKQA